MRDNTIGSHGMPQNTEMWKVNLLELSQAIVEALEDIHQDLLDLNYNIARWECKSKE